ncbi:hypothetical protein SUGI_0205010 [Cryptomeria japonica]|nr:hypothetical protein SUGI_0205010 [Cryptomeria japonica]
MVDVIKFSSHSLSFCEKANPAKGNHHRRQRARQFNISSLYQVLHCELHNELQVTRGQGYLETPETGIGTGTTNFQK